MNTLFVKLDSHEILELNSENVINHNIPLIQRGNPLTCEIRRLSIVSDKWNTFRDNKFMLVNRVKNKASKDRTLENITYYDDSVETITILVNGEKKKKYSIGPFDPGEYGNPICFHTPGYEGTTINISTEAWNIHDNSIIKSLTSMVTSALGMVTTVSPYIQLAIPAVNIMGSFLQKEIKHEELSNTHVLEISLDSGIPLCVGKYILLPDLTDYNIKIDLLKNYVLRDNMLMKKLDDKFIEFDQTYYIIKITDKPREDLADFDYAASHMELVKLFNQADNNPDIMNQLADISKQAYNSGVLQTLFKYYDSYLDSGSSPLVNEPESKNIELLKRVKALYNQLGSQKSWFEKYHASIFSEIQKLK